jgi:hypothetical protein
MDLDLNVGAKSATQTSRRISYAMFNAASFGITTEASRDGTSGPGKAGSRGAKSRNKLAWKLTRSFV